MNVFFLSFGKDSIAQLFIARAAGISIDKVVYCDIRYSEELSGEHPLMAHWIPTAKRILKEKLNVDVEVITAELTFKDWFYRVKQKGNHKGDIYGFPYVVGAWCNSRLKLDVIDKYERDLLRKFPDIEIVEYVGIAYDEMKRYETLCARKTRRGVRKESVLVKYGVTEESCTRIAKRHNLYSPIYTLPKQTRAGCWFCPKQSLAALKNIWLLEPELYQILMNMERDSYNTMRADGKTLAELAERFQSEEEAEREGD